jgi:glycosyltransferase involved in cell wall biosynthesis
MVALQKRLRRSDVPLLAWCFNVGQFPHGLKRKASRVALKKVDRFVVHSTGEISKVSEFLDVPPSKVEFVPLQRAPIALHAAEDTKSPFVVAMGSANRDYETFFRAAELSGLRCRVVASRRSLEGLRIPPNVSIESGLGASECHAIVQQSRFSVIPILDPTIASGQVTVNESMRMNKPVIATQSIGTTDYIRNGETGVLIRPHDPEALAEAMLQLWDDRVLREKYARNAADFAATVLSDEAAAESLARIISELEAQR